MICPKCSYGMTQLFLTWACDRCDGLLPEAKAPVCEGGEIRYCYTVPDSDVYRNRLPFREWNELLVFNTKQAALDDMGPRTGLGDRVILTVLGGRPQPAAVCAAFGISAIWNEAQRRSPDEALIVFHEIV